MVERTNSINRIATVLFIDDEQVLVNLFQRMFTDHEDYRFIGFSDPREAMLSYAQSSDGIDLVLTDYSMPNHSGDDVARHFRSLTPGIPIIGMSSDPGQFDPSLFDLTMAKTVVREHLTDAMHRVLRGAK